MPPTSWQHEWIPDSSIPYRASRRDYWVCTRCGSMLKWFPKPPDDMEVTVLSNDVTRPGVKMSCEAFVLYKVMES